MCVFDERCRDRVLDFHHLCWTALATARGASGGQSAAQRPILENKVWSVAEYKVNDVYVDPRSSLEICALQASDHDMLIMASMFAAHPQHTSDKKNLTHKRCTTLLPNFTGDTDTRTCTLCKYTLIQLPARARGSTPYPGASNQATVMTSFAES